METDERAHDQALCAFLMLWRRDRVDAILGVLPVDREQAIRERLTELSGLSLPELAQRIRRMRRDEFEKAVRKCRSDRLFRLEAAPPALRRWLAARYQERHGREDHQVGPRT